MNNEEHMSVSEAAKEWGCSKSTIYRRINDGLIDTVPHYGRVMIPREDVESGASDPRVKPRPYKYQD